MADTKISELPANTTPDSTAIVPVVESSTTSKSTVSQLVGAVQGWFSVGDNGASQTGIADATETKVEVDAALSGQGGYDYLPHGISSSDVYDSSTSKIKLGWLSVGQLIYIEMNGDLTTGTGVSKVTFTFKFFSSGDVEQTALRKDIQLDYSASTSYPFNAQTIAFINSTLAADGYCTIHMTFDGGSGNTINMGSFTVCVLA